MAIMEMILVYEIAYPGKGIADKDPFILFFLMNTKADHVSLIVGKAADKILCCPYFAIPGKVGKSARNVDGVPESCKLNIVCRLNSTEKFMPFINSGI